MHSRRAYSWRAAYLAAVWEVGPSKEFGRIVDALIKIEARIKDDAGMDVAERRAIESARHQLRIMEAQRVLDRLHESAQATPSRRSQLIN
jgi:hypothetical protein